MSVVTVPRVNNSLALQPQNQLVERKRKSDLVKTGHSSLFAPNVLLQGHRAQIYTCRFNPKGRTLASAGHDKDIFLWNCFDDCENTALLKGHKNAVLQLCWHRGGEILASASVDHTAAVWDAEAGARIKQIKEHTSFVNSVSLTRRGFPQLLTGSDDGSAKLFDLRAKKSIATFDCMYQCTAVSWSDDGQTVYTGGIDNDIKIWDVRQRKQIGTFEAHDDTITHLSLSPDGFHLLSNAMDMRIHCWDLRPYVSDEKQKPNARLVKTFMGATHSEEQLLLRCNWSHDGKYVCSGSSNRMVYIWNFHDTKLKYSLPGHDASVNEVDMHPSEKVVLSGGSDKRLYMGELH